MSVPYPSGSSKKCFSSLLVQLYGAPIRIFPSPNELAKSNLDVPAVSDYIQRIQDNIALARDRHAES